MSTLATPILKVATIAMLRSIAPAELADGTAVFVQGYHVPGDGGAGNFFYKAASTDGTDGGTIFAPADGGGRWCRIYSGPLNVRWFGARGDGAADDAGALKAALAAAAHQGAVYLPAGDYFIGETGLVVAGSTVVTGDGSAAPSDNLKVTRITYVGAGSAIVVNNGSGPATQGVRIENLCLNGSPLQGRSRGAIGLTIGALTSEPSDRPRSVKGEIANVVVTGFTTAGVQVVAAQGVGFRNLRAIYNGGDGVVLGAPSVTVNSNTINTFDGCEFSNNGAPTNPARGVVVYDMLGHVFSRCTAEANYGAGVHVEKVTDEVGIEGTFDRLWLEGNNRGEPGQGMHAQLVTTGAPRVSAPAVLTFREPYLSRSPAPQGKGTYYAAYLACANVTFHDPIYPGVITLPWVRVAAGPGAQAGGRLVVFGQDPPYRGAPSNFTPLTGGVAVYAIERSDRATFTQFKWRGPGGGGAKSWDEYYFSQGDAIYRSTGFGGFSAWNKQGEAGQEAMFVAMVGGDTPPLPGGLGGAQFGVRRTPSGGSDLVTQRINAEGTAMLDAFVNSRLRELTSGVPCAVAVLQTPPLGVDPKRAGAAGGTLHYTVKAANATDAQVRTGLVKWAAIRQGESVTGSVTDLTANQAFVQTPPDGVLRVEWRFREGVLEVVATSSLQGEVTLALNFSLFNESELGLRAATQ